MVTHQCDNCKTIIKKGEQLVVGRSIYREYFELCPECATPVLAAIYGAALRPSLKQQLKEKIDSFAD